MKRAPRFKTGSVVFDRRRKVWNFLWRTDGKRQTRRIGTLAEYPSKSAARRAARSIQFSQMKILKPQPKETITLSILIGRYRAERMPKRSDTRRAYEVWIGNHILPKWGNLTDMVEAHGKVVGLALNGLQPDYKPS